MNPITLNYVIHTLTEYQTFTSLITGQIIPSTTSYDLTTQILTNYLNKVSYYNDYVYLAIENVLGYISNIISEYDAEILGQSTTRTQSAIASEKFYNSVLQLQAYLESYMQNYVVVNLGTQTLNLQSITISSI